METRQMASTANNLDVFAKVTPENVVAYQYVQGDTTINHRMTTAYDQLKLYATMFGNLLQ